jgi:hypothetical protein
MRNFIAALLTLASVTIAMPAMAGARPVVVELYTSQGCSSCPAADALLTKLDKRDGVIALALHVDYWDYIGWKDVFGSPANTTRQKSYARAAGRRTIYTPQMVISGVGHVVGSKPMEVVDQIDAARSVDNGITLTLARNGNKVTISATATSPAQGDLIVQLVRYEPSETVAITRGENAGLTIDYTNIVTEWRQIGTWDGRAPLSMKVKAAGAQPVVVIVQEPGPGRILAAERLR